MIQPSMVVDVGFAVIYSMADGCDGLCGAGNPLPIGDGLKFA